MNRRAKIIAFVNEQADKKTFYVVSQKFGMLAAESFREQDKENKRKQHRAQMTGLENIAETTQKVSDVLDYIKRQTARQDGWKKELKEYDGKRFGEILKDYIEHDLEKICETVCGKIGIGEATDKEMYDRQQVYLQLIRQLIRQLVVQYEYEVSKPKQSFEEAGNKAES